MPKGLALGLEEPTDGLEEPASGRGLLELVDAADANDDLPVFRLYERTITRIVRHLVDRLERLVVVLRPRCGAYDDGFRVTCADRASASGELGQERDGVTMARLEDKRTIERRREHEHYLAVRRLDEEVDTPARVYAVYVNPHAPVGAPCHDVRRNLFARRGGVLSDYFEIKGDGTVACAEGGIDFDSTRALAPYVIPLSAPSSTLPKRRRW